MKDLVISYLKSQSSYQNILTYADWLEKHGLTKTDPRIDLVAQARTGEYCVVQYEKLEPDHRVAMNEAGSLSADSSKVNFTRCIIMISTNSWGRSVMPALKSPTYASKKLHAQQQRSVFEPIENGLTTAVHGKLIMTRSTYKGFTTLTITENAIDDLIVFLLPGISLLSQTVMEWTQDGQTLLNTFAERPSGKASEKPSCVASQVDNDFFNCESRAIGNVVQTYFNDIYPWLCVSKEHVLYYIYGLIHNDAYRARYADSPCDESPPTPSTEDFSTYIGLGRKLLALHHST